MKPVYKRVKVLKEHCPTCGEQLRGNNSYNSPWECKCGIWEVVKYPFTGDYQVKKKNLKE